MGPTEHCDWELNSLGETSEVMELRQNCNQVRRLFLNVETISHKPRRLKGRYANYPSLPSEPAIHGNLADQHKLDHGKPTEESC